MAATFDATTDRLSIPGFTVPAAGSASFWIKPTWAYNDGAYHGFYSMRASPGPTPYFEFFKATDNHLYAGLGSTQKDFGLASGLTQNAWNHLFVTWDDSADTAACYVNGSSLFSGSFTFALGASLSGETFYVGNFKSGVLDNDCRGDIADFCIWSAGLSAGEIGSLAKGFSAVLVRPASIFRSFSLIRDFKELKTGATITNTNVTVGNHAPLLYPRTRKAA